MRPSSRTIAAGAAPLLLALTLGPASLATQSTTVAAAVWSVPAAINDDGRAAEQREPALARDGLGGLHAVWVDARDGSDRGAIYYAHRPPAAEAWAANQRVAGPEGAAAFTDPAVAVDTIGRVHVVWTEFRDGDPDIYHRVLSSGARVWSAPRRVNDDPGAAIQWHPALAVDLWGTTHIAWTDYRAGSADIFYTRVLADDWWAPNVRVNEPAAGDQQQVQLTGTPTGDVHAVWQDTRDGQADIFASRLPPGGGVWWPNARLNRSTGRALQHGASVSADGDGAVHSVWIDEGVGGDQAIRAATLRPEQPYWDPDRVLYRPDNGRVLSTALAGGPGDNLGLWWGESRPTGGRIYAGDLSADGTVVKERVDGSPMVADGTGPVAVVDDAGRATVLWRGVPAGATHGEIFASTARLTAPTFEPVTLTGRLQYRNGADQCTGEGWVVVSCDGLPSTMILNPGGLALLPFLATNVVLTGHLETSGGCPRVVAETIRLEASRCPTEAGAITGLVTADSVPVAGATVRLGGETAVTGASGRYFLDLVPPGTHAVSVTAPCALTLGANAVVVRPRAVTDLGAGPLVRGDVVPNCAVDLEDLVAVASQYKARPPFHPACTDLDGDGAVSLYDLVAVASSYDLGCPTGWSGAGDKQRSGRGSAPALAADQADDLGPVQAARIVAAVPVPAPVPTQPGDVVLRLRGRAPVSGWALALPYDATRTVITDQDPVAAGIQPFRIPAGPAPAWVVENRTDGQGWLYLTVALLGGEPARSDGVELARLHATGVAIGGRGSWYAWLAGPNGRPVASTVELVGGAGGGPEAAWLRALELLADRLPR